MRTKIAFIFLFILIADIYSQTFQTNLSSSRVGVGEQFELSYTFSGSDINSLANYKAPDLKDFIVLGGPNQSTSMQIINGAVSASRTFSYYLQAKSQGKFTIGPANISFKGSTLKAEAVSIEVVKGQATAKQRQQEEQGVSNGEIADNLFIRAYADKATVYQGEQVNITYKLYTRLNIASPQISKLPSYPGFWSEEIPLPPNINFTRENLDGKVFNVAVIKRAALFPSQSGQLSVTPFELEIPVAVQKKRRSNNPFDDFFNDPFFQPTETVRYNAKSNTVKLNVLPLPGGAPESFTGAVGSFNIKASLDKNKTKQNEAVTLRVEVSGTGNIELLQIPEIKIPAGFEKYDPKINSEISRSGEVSGKKAFEFLLIPREQGSFDIPETEFSFFSPQKKSYARISFPALKIEVGKGDAEYTSTGGGNKELIKLLQQDIRYIKTSSDDLYADTAPLISRSYFWLMSILPLLGLTALIVYRRREDKLNSNAALLKITRARSIAKKKLKSASKLMAAGKEIDFYIEISDALQNFLEGKLRYDRADFTLDGVVERLVNAGFPEDKTKLLREVIELCEFKKFAPSSVTGNSMQEVYDKAGELIAEIEERIK